VLTVLTYPDPRLRQKSKNITQFDESLHTLLKGMAETMNTLEGVGISAPQVNHFQRVFLVDLRSVEPSQSLHEFINPKLSNFKGKVKVLEGCLSFPDANYNIKRAASLTIEYQDRHGTKKSLSVDGLFAVAIQHEFDHLEGVLFIDRLSLWQKLALFVKKVWHTP